MVLEAEQRSDAHFKISQKSSVWGATAWEITVTTKGVVAYRKQDRRRVAITWEQLIGTAMFYGIDSKRDGKVEL